MSYAPQVKTGTDPKWYGNALRFSTEKEAKANVLNLMSRWIAVVDTRTVVSSDPVNYAWEKGALVHLGGE